MVGTPKYELVQDRLGVSLAEQLRYWQRAGVPATAIAWMLTDTTRVQLSSETIRQWLRALSEPNGDEGEAA